MIVSVRFEVKIVDNWVQVSVKWNPCSRIIPFSEGIWNNILTIKDCLRTIDLLFF